MSEPKRGMQSKIRPGSSESKDVSGNRSEDEANLTNRRETTLRSGSSRVETKVLSVTALMSKISSGSSKHAYKALVEIRTKLIKEKDGIARIRQRKGPQIFLDTLAQEDKKVLDVCLSVLGNCCMDGKFRTEVIQRDGVATVGTLLQETNSPSIQNRACRTLANLSLDTAGCKAIHQEEGLLEKIIEILKGTTDPECQQTISRTIRLLSDNKQHRASVLELRGLKIVADLVKSEDEAVQQSALKMISHYVNEHPTQQCALQLELSEISKFFMSAVIDSPSHLKRYIENMVLIMVKEEVFRPGLGNAGSIPYFIDRSRDFDVDFHKKFAYINALCLSCKESLNRVRVRENEGLPLLIEILRDEKFSKIHNRIISALLCFLYDEPSFQILLKNDIVSLLMEHLDRCYRGHDTSSDPNMLVTASLREQIEILLERVVIDDDVEPSNNENTDISPTAPQTHVTESLASETQCEVGRTLVNNKVPCIITCDRPEHDADDVQTAKRHDTKYSMDSPTYKEISESHSAQNYDPDGPTNILDCQDMDSASSGYRSPSSSPGSPLSTYSTNSESFSPLSNASYVSPTWSTSYSPERSEALSWSPPRALSPLSCDVSISSPSSSSPRIHTSHTWPGQFSPLSVVSYESPVKSPSSREASSSGGETGPCVALEYSSEEEEEEQDTIIEAHTVHSLENETDVKLVPEEGASGTENGVMRHKEADEPKNATDNQKQACPITADKDQGILSSVAGKEEKMADHAMADVDKPSQYPNDCEEKDGTESKTTISSRDPDITTEANILIFLSRISFMGSPKYLARSSVLEGILRYIISCTHAPDENITRARRILMRLLQNRVCLDIVISTGFPMILSLMCNDARTDKKGGAIDSSKDSLEELAEECLQALALVSQDRYGRGVITHALLRNSVSLKMMTYLSLPLIYSNIEELKPMLDLMQEGIDFVLHALLSTTDLLTTAAFTFLAFLTKICSFGSSKYHDWHMESATSDTTISESLKRKRGSSEHSPSPKQKTKRRNVEIEAHDNQDHETNIASDLSGSFERLDMLDIEFVSSDDISIRASKETMMNASVVFSAMFQGSFSESKQNRIQLSDVNSSSFQILVDYLHSMDCPRTYLEKASVPNLLDLLILSERYFMHRLHKDVCTVVYEQMNSGEDNLDDILQVLKIALIHNGQWLAEMCIAKILDVTILLQSLKAALIKFLQTSEDTNLLRDFKSILMHKLQ